MLNLRFSRQYEEPRSKLLGIFVGEEIYCTGDGPYPNPNIGLQFFQVL
jgi:hypothetical protein